MPATGTQHVVLGDDRLGVAAAEAVGTLAAAAAVPATTTAATAPAALVVLVEVPALLALRGVLALVWLPGWFWPWSARFCWLCRSRGSAGPAGRLGSAGRRGSAGRGCAGGPDRPGPRAGGLAGGGGRVGRGGRLRWRRARRRPARWGADSRRPGCSAHSDRPEAAGAPDRAAVIASMSWPLRMRAVPLMPRPEAICCSSASTIAFSPRAGAATACVLGIGVGGVDSGAVGDPLADPSVEAGSAGRASTTSVVVSLKMHSLRKRDSNVHPGRAEAGSHVAGPRGICRGIRPTKGDSLEHRPVGHLVRRPQ